MAADGIEVSTLDRPAEGCRRSSFQIIVKSLQQDRTHNRSQLLSIETCGFADALGCDQGDYQHRWGERSKSVIEHLGFFLYFKHLALECFGDLLSGGNRATV